MLGLDQRIETLSLVRGTIVIDLTLSSPDLDPERLDRAIVALTR